MSWGDNILGLNEAVGGLSDVLADVRVALVSVRDLNLRLVVALLTVTAISVLVPVTVVTVA